MKEYSITVIVRGDVVGAAQKIYDSLRDQQYQAFTSADEMFARLSDATKLMHVIGVSLETKSSVPIDMRIKYNVQK